MWGATVPHAAAFAATLAEPGAAEALLAAGRG